MKTLWRIEMLGGLQARQGERLVTRFHTQKNALLLAYLACHTDRPHSRDVLIEMLWPDVDVEVGRNRMRQALSSLRRLIEPPDLPAKSVLMTDRATVRLNPAILTTDVGDLEAALTAAQGYAGTEQAQALMHAINLYRGDLLPGYYAEWVTARRDHLHEAVTDAAQRLVAHFERDGDYERGCEYAHRMVALDPLNEAGHQALIRLYLRMGQKGPALRQYRELERRLQTELDQAPAAATRDMFLEVGNLDSREHQVGARVHFGRPGTSTFQHSAPELAFNSFLPPPGILAARLPHALPEKNAHVDDIDLPIQFTRFCGREQETAQLLALLSASPYLVNSPADATLPRNRSNRLITLTGPGGCGKTRLAIEVARQHAEAHGAAVRFVPLADLSHPSGIVAAIADAVNLRNEVQSWPLIVEALSQRPTLLLLDGLEHLFREPEAADLPPQLATADEPPWTVAMIVQELLCRAPSLICLATSRRRLDMAAEHEFPLLPLEVPLEIRKKEPNAKEGASVVPFAPAALLALPAVQLFVERAQASRPDFQLTARTAPAIAALLARLEGLPLAIELAAAWAQSLTAAQMLERLDHRFELLTSRRHDLPLRHRSLHANVEWSYRLLSREPQALFACLSVFRNGWTAEAAGAVCTTNSDLRLIETLTDLRASSMVYTLEREQAMRWQMLETWREFGDQQLTAEERSLLAQRHAHYYMQFAEEIAPRLTGAEQDQSRRQLDAEHDNLLAALTWSVEQAPLVALRLAAAIWRYWALTGQFSVGRQWLERALSVPDGAWQTRALALNGAGVLAQHEGDYAAALNCYERAMVLSRDHGYCAGMAHAHNNLGRLAYSQGDNRAALAHYEASLGLWRELQDPHYIAVTLNNLGVILREQSETGVAAAVLQESLVLKREQGDRQGIAAALNNLALIAYDQEDFATAAAFCYEALLISREMDNRIFVATNLHNLARVRLAENDWYEAARLLAQGLTLRREVGDRPGIVYSLEGSAEWATALHRFEAAARLFGAAALLRETIGAPVPPPERAVNDRAQSQGRGYLGGPRYDAIMRVGRTMPLAQAIDFALDLLRTDLPDGLEKWTPARPDTISPGTPARHRKELSRRRSPEFEL